MVVCMMIERLFGRWLDNDIKPKFEFVRVRECLRLLAREVQAPFQTVLARDLVTGTIPVALCLSKRRIMVDRLILRRVPRQVSCKGGAGRMC